MARMIAHASIKQLPAGMHRIEDSSFANVHPDRVNGAVRTRVFKHARHGTGIASVWTGVRACRRSTCKQSRPIGVGA